jgi:hypothetical protein
LLNIKKMIEEHNVDGDKPGAHKKQATHSKQNSFNLGPSGKPEQISADLYKPATANDTTLQFESRFESGNLLAAIKLSATEYDLVLQNDINTNGHT